jgi:hypothetical protein
MGTGAKGAADAGAEEGLTEIGLLSPEEGKLFLGAGITGLPGGINGGSISDIFVRFSLGKSIGACLN